MFLHRISAFFFAITFVFAFAFAFDKSFDSFVLRVWVSI